MNHRHEKGLASRVYKELSNLSITKQANADKHMKRCSTSLAVPEHKVKQSETAAHSSSRTAKTRHRPHPGRARIPRGGLTHTLQAGMQTGAASLENSSALKNKKPGEGNCNPLQYSCPENPMGTGAWLATVRGVTRVGHDSVTKPPPPPRCLETVL